MKSSVLLGCLFLAFPLSTLVAGPSTAYPQDTKPLPISLSTCLQPLQSYWDGGFLRVINTSRYNTIAARVEWYQNNTWLVAEHRFLPGQSRVYTDISHAPIVTNCATMEYYPAETPNALFVAAIRWRDLTRPAATPIEKALLIRAE